MTNEIDQTVDEHDGALPSLDSKGNEEVLGVPESRVKAKTNVKKSMYVIALLAGLLFIVFGFLFFMKARKDAAPVQAAKPVPAKVDKTKVKNSALDSASLERVKADIKKREEQENQAKAAYEAKLAAAGGPAAGPGAAGAAAGAAGAGGPAQGQGGAQGGYSSQNTGQGAQAAPPRPLTLTEQRLGGDVLLNGAAPAAAAQSAGGNPLQAAQSALAGLAGQGQGRAQMAEYDNEDAAARRAQDRPKAGSLKEMLQPTVFEARSAGRLGNLDWLLKKGMTIPCALRTGIDTTLPGFLSCVVISDVYSANGANKVIDRGATFFGEQRSTISQGQARVFVLWNRVDNPNGVFAEIDSPATDEMGYGGIGGHVETHFWKRFGGAIMLSLIQDAVSAATDRRSEGAVEISNTSGQGNQMAAEALKGTINIPPTISVLPGKVINVMVNRDISFNSVYKVVK